MKKITSKDRQEIIKSWYAVDKNSLQDYKSHTVPDDCISVYFVNKKGFVGVYGGIKPKLLSTINVKCNLNQLKILKNYLHRAGLTNRVVFIKSNDKKQLSR